MRTYGPKTRVGLLGLVSYTASSLGSSRLASRLAAPRYRKSILLDAFQKAARGDDLAGATEGPSINLASPKSVFSTAMADAPAPRGFDDWACQNRDDRIREVSALRVAMGDAAVRLVEQAPSPAARGA